MYQSAFSNDQYDYGMAMGTLLFVVVLTRRSEQRPGHYQGRAASWLSLFSPSTPYITSPNGVCVAELRGWDSNPRPADY
jgi:hypothetical protein